MKNRPAVAIFGALILTNTFWFLITRNLEHLYLNLDAEYIQAASERDDLKTLLFTLPDPTVYHLAATARGEALVSCLNGGDATVRPVNEFGKLVVSCGR